MVEAGAWLQILALALPLPSSGNSLKSACTSVPHVCTGTNISVSHTVAVGRDRFLCLEHLEHTLREHPLF